MSSISKTIIYILFTLSLFVGLIFQENSAGGAIHDINHLKPYIEKFQDGFKSGMLYYLNNINIHSPFFFIFVSFFNNLFSDTFHTEILYIIISSFLPILFYQILKIKFDYNKNLLFWVSCLIFISPYFRSSAIWLLGDNLALIFFSISLIYYLKFTNDKKNLYLFLCITSIIICCYVRYYYALFYFFYLFSTYKDIKFKFLFLILTYSFVISLPAFFYIYLIINNYNFLDTVFTYSKLNYFGNIFIILSLILFYIFPFIFYDLKIIKKYYQGNIKEIIFLSLPLIIVYFFDLIFNNNLIDFSPLGGGVFIKLLNLIELDLKISLLIISIVSILILNFYLRKNFIRNYALLLLFILSFPMYTLFQKYFDPLIYIFLLGLITYSEKKCLLNINRSKVLSLYLYFLSFYFFSLFYYY
tara:strand:- start:646 stop:1887 length:1242 start_codon:yes stop_codon:yes gene_type:complete